MSRSDEEARPSREAVKRLARRLDLESRDLEEPSASEDLEARVETGQESVFPPAPFSSYEPEPPPELGEEPLDRYPLEEEKPPATGDVPLDTDVALGLDDDIHKESKGEPGRGRTREGREGRRRRGTA